jgi:hypothetical protein
MMTGPADEACQGATDPLYLTQGQGMVMHSVPDEPGDHRRQPAVLLRPSRDDRRTARRDTVTTPERGPTCKVQNQCRSAQRGCRPDSASRSTDRSAVRVADQHVCVSLHFGRASGVPGHSSREFRRSEGSSAGTKGRSASKPRWILGFVAERPMLTPGCSRQRYGRSGGEHRLWASAGGKAA